MASVFHTRLNDVSTPRIFERFQEDAEYRPVDGGKRDIKVCVIGRLGGSGGQSRRRENEQFHQKETSLVDVMVYEHSSTNAGITKAKKGDVIILRGISWSFQEELSKDGDVFTIRLTSSQVLESGRVNIGL